jgi:hypothetical protein
MFISAWRQWMKEQGYVLFSASLSFVIGLTGFLLAILTIIDPGKAKHFDLPVFSPLYDSRFFTIGGALIAISLAAAAIWSAVSVVNKVNNDKNLTVKVTVKELDNMVFNIDLGD